MKILESRNSTHFKETRCLPVSTFSTSRKEEKQRARKGHSSLPPPKINKTNGFYRFQGNATFLFLFFREAIKIHKNSNVFQESPAFLCSSCANEKTSRTWNSTNSKRSRLFYFFSITKIRKSRNLTRSKRFYPPRKISETKDSIISKKSTTLFPFLLPFFDREENRQRRPNRHRRKEKFPNYRECFSFPTFSHFAWFAKVTVGGQKAIPLDSLSSNFFWS